jgi:hypothetical protein
MQKHLNRECECGSLFEDQCSPHVFVIDLKLRACHVFVLLVHALAATHTAGSFTSRGPPRHLARRISPAW